VSLWWGSSVHLRLKGSRGHYQPWPASASAVELYSAVVNRCAGRSVALALTTARPARPPTPHPSPVRSTEFDGYDEDETVRVSQTPVPASLRFAAARVAVSVARRPLSRALTTPPTPSPPPPQRSS
jgi:hypothetical protein